MFTYTKKLKLVFVGALYGMMVSLPAAALLFVLDTSGSMSTSVHILDAYDPTIDYKALGHAPTHACYDPNRVYAIANNASSFLDIAHFGNTVAEELCHHGFNNEVREFNRSAVVCDAAGSLDTTGFYTGVISQYRGGNWTSNLATSDLTAFVECQVDRGIHGQTTGNANVWASKSGSPWSTVSANEIDWGNAGVSKTLYSGRYLNYVINGPVTHKARIDIMKDVMKGLVNSVTGVNIGLMRFSRNGAGGMVVAPIDDIGPATATGAGTQRKVIEDELNRMTPSGSTPLSESFYEAVMYFRGKNVDYGLNSTEAGSWPGKSYPSVPSSRSGNKYISPITNECQKNFVVILTDGDPVSDSLNSTRKDKIDKGMTNAAVSNSNCGGSNNCLDEIARSIGRNDQSTTLTGDQFISTFTIGFDNQNALLQDTADESLAATGEGERFFANNEITLIDSLNKIVASVFKTDASFSSPAVSVNAFNRAVHLDDLYFTLFKPGIGAHWVGNFKKYKLDFFVDTNDEDGDGDTTERLPFIKDANSNRAVNPITGFFADGSQGMAAAQSYWSANPDGKDVGSGGAANQFEVNNTRNVYTYTDTYTNNQGVFEPKASTADLTALVNKVDKGNTAIVDGSSMLNISGLPDKITGTPLRQTLLDWASGLDVFDLFGTAGTTNDMRLEMGDPLHAQPALVQYGAVSGNPDLVAYVATNDGYLHAFDVDDGKELFSFIPQELLSNLNELMDNSSGSKTYGLDGDVVAWINDANDDGKISGASEHVYLYVGMRRGGRNIYSLDVTDRNNPKLRWVIKGGVGAYANLGQTWSSINVEKIKDGATERNVLIFGGGYDTNQDNDVARSSTGDSVGNSVYIADAETGALLWSGGLTGDTTVAEMKYSIPARVKPLDLSGDGNIDRLYVADMGGQIFRFDLDESKSSFNPADVKGGRIADLAVDGSKADARRFYYPPDVALISERGKSSYLALAISSGYRAHPNDTDIHDRIYMLKDKDVYNIPSSYVTLTESDLYDATLNLVAGNGSAAQNDAAKAALASTEGWYIFLNDDVSGNWLGEKGLSESLILENTVYVTTFTPKLSASVNSCSPEPGTGKLFAMDITNAAPVPSASTSQRPGRNLFGIAKGGIPPAPNVVVTKGGEPTICIGTECKAADLIKGVRRTFWHEVEK